MSKLCVKVQDYQNFEMRFLCMENLLLLQVALLYTSCQSFKIPYKLMRSSTLEHTSLWNTTFSGKAVI
jgi:hypothetical protein